jgi:hypothetical protein
MTEEYRDAELTDDNDDSENTPLGNSSEGDTPKTIEMDRYKHLQAAYTQTNQEIGALRQKLGELESQRVDNKSSAESDALAWLESEDVQEELDADPSLVTKYLKKAVSMASSQLETELVQTLQERDAYYHMKFMSQDPEYRESVDQIEALRKEEPKFVNLSDEQLLAIVKRTGGSGKSAQGSKREFRGNPGGGRNVSQSGGKGGDPRKSELYKKIYGGE